ncbi:hypothetical protein J5N97_020489 [Dioscorea zingiberensis]|uniref:Uncharacterized protein n=1 Tax=Dioscorea zingiberensis TaxID=325984 RepID=A0A9D5HDQ0_9LILI|nr:hypothetical protein J5N97_020486 [Dioscorea zingiberensis]KAJ0972530.1 hypothetical protein J5N97_020489 [Dioscorea zingiberensis]
MESEKKIRGLKGKIVRSFYRAPKPSVQYYSKVKPAPMTSLVEEEYALPSKTINGKEATFMKQGAAAKTVRSGELTDEDNIDIRTASYISYVRESLMQERNGG